MLDEIDSVMIQGQVESDKRINLLFDEVSQHYRIIAKLTGATAKRFALRRATKGVDMKF